MNNFAWACPFCNNRKNQRLFYPASGPRIVRLFDPRYDTWGEHFFFANEYSVIWGRSPIGQATVDALAMNDLRPESLAAQRLALILANRYPPDWARKFLVTEQ